MNIKPIHSDAEHAEAMARIDTLWGAADNTSEGDELDVLATLVDAYERSLWPLDDVDPIDALQSVMLDQGYTQADLARLLGSRSRASEVLGRKRALTTEMIWSISRAWNVPADLLVKPYPLGKVA